MEACLLALPQIANADCDRPITSSRVRPVVASQASLTSRIRSSDTRKITTASRLARKALSKMTSVWRRASFALRSAVTSRELATIPPTAGSARMSVSVTDSVA